MLDDGLRRISGGRRLFRLVKVKAAGAGCAAVIQASLFWIGEFLVGAGEQVGMRF